MLKKATIHSKVHSPQIWEVLYELSEINTTHNGLEGSKRGDGLTQSSCVCFKQQDSRIFGFEGQIAQSGEKIKSIFKE